MRPAAPTPRSNGWPTARAAALAGAALLLAPSGCRDTPTEPSPPAAPIVLTGGGVPSPDGNRSLSISVDVCGCVPEAMQIRVNGLPAEPLACSESRRLSRGGVSVERTTVTVSTASWSVDYSYAEPVDPHVNWKVEARCR